MSNGYRPETMRIVKIIALVVSIIAVCGGWFLVTERRLATIESTHFTGRDGRIMQEEIHAVDTRVAVLESQYTEIIKRLDALLVRE